MEILKYAPGVCKLLSTLLWKTKLENEVRKPIRLSDVKRRGALQKFRQPRKIPSSDSESPKVKRIGGNRVGTTEPLSISLHGICHPLQDDCFILLGLLDDFVIALLSAALLVCAILVPQSGVESTLSVVEAWSLTHWTNRKVSLVPFFISLTPCTKPAMIINGSSLPRNN